MTDDTLPLAAVLLAYAMPLGVDSSCDAADAAIAAARAAGASPVVVVVREGAAAPRDVRVVRVVRVKPGAPWISAVRSGMALLANTPARLVLVWMPDIVESVDVALLPELVAAARRSDAAVTAISERTLASGPVVVARDAWLELLTLGEQGMQAVAARRGACYLTPS